MKITAITTEEFRWPRHKPISNGKHTYTHVAFAWSRSRPTRASPASASAAAARSSGRPSST